MPLQILTNSPNEDFWSLENVVFHINLHITGIRAAALEFTSTEPGF